MEPKFVGRYKSRITRNHQLKNQQAITAGWQSPGKYRSCDRGDGADFFNQQRLIDEAKNERMKHDNDETKLDPEQVQRRKNREYKPDVDIKKTGSGKH